MKVVYKYPLPQDENTLTLPVGAKVVHAGMQGTTPMLWIEHQQPYPGQKTETRVITLFGTGHPVPDFAGHLGSVFDGPFVWHIYQTAPWVEAP